MKLNIVADHADDRQGYTNVTPGDVDLFYLGVPGEYDEVVALGVLEYIPLDRVDRALDHWCDLVAVGGRITVGSLDLLEVADAVTKGRLPSREANILLHGRQEGAFGHKHANYTTQVLSEALAGRGLKVVRRNIHGLHGVVTATRE